MRRGFDDVPGSLPSDGIPPHLDINTVPFSALAESVLNKLSGSIIDDGALWRDFLSMTGKIRTFFGRESIKEEWASYSQERLPRDFKATGSSISRPTPS